MKDCQQAAPAAWCRWCGRELYPGEEAWALLGVIVHSECLAEFARSESVHWTLEEKGRRV